MDSNKSNSHDSQYHVVLFPFMSKGHTIPLLHLARLLLLRRVIVTVFTTPANRLFVSESLSGTAASIIDLPFPCNIPGIPDGVESTDKLPSISLYPQFALATKLMQPDFERAVEILPPVNFMVSDGLLWWTLESAMRFGFPRLVYYGMSYYSMCITRAVAEVRPKSDDELIIVPQFPWIKVTRDDFDPPLGEIEPNSPLFEFKTAFISATSKSHGLLVNSFYELESVFVDHWRKTYTLKAWCVGPLPLAEPLAAINHEPDHKEPTWIHWLDQKIHQGKSVLYVAFGSQAEISMDQLQEIARGLEESEINFLWVIRKKESDLEDGFEERVKERGIIVRDWVDQREILNHQSVQGFLSHCGWNSVLESICAGVPILAWPMMAEQPLNARMVVEEIKVGLRVETCNGSVRGFVKRESLREMVKELMEGETGKNVRKNVMEFTEMAKKAMAERTGSSWCSFHTLIEQYRKKK